MIRGDKIYEGKAKILYQSDNPNEIIQFFKDDATAFNNQKKAIIKNKGILNNLISEFLMIKISEKNIPNHFIKRLSDREQLVRKVKIIPLEIIIRNISAGSMAKRLGMEEEIILSQPIFEICYKKDELEDPIINDSHAVIVLKIINEQQLEFIKKLSFKINELLIDIFSEIYVQLVDFKLEFGFDSDNNIILADEISPDSCRLWSKKNNEKLDKDVFRRDLGSLTDAYKKIANAFAIDHPICHSVSG